MKQNLIFILTIGTLLFWLFSACEPHKDKVPQISIDLSEVTFSCDGGSCTVTLRANCPWMVALPSDTFFKITPTTGIGDEIISISVPGHDEIEDRGFMLNFTGTLDGRIALGKLLIRQLSQPGRASFSNVVVYDIFTDISLPGTQLLPYRGCFSLNVEANSEWFLTSNPPLKSIAVERGWPGITENYFWYDANICGKTIEYHLMLDCVKTSSGSWGDTLVMVQPPSIGTLSLVSITPSSDGETIPSSGADVILKVETNTYWAIKYDPDIRHLYPGSGAPKNKEVYVTVPVPPYDEPEGRTLRFWLLLSEILETEPLVLTQR